MQSNIYINLNSMGQNMEKSRFSRVCGIKMVNKQLQTNGDSLAGLDKTGWGYGRKEEGESSPATEGVSSVVSSVPQDRMPDSANHVSGSVAPAAQPITPLFDFLGFQKGRDFFPGAERTLVSSDHPASRHAVLSGDVPGQGSAADNHAHVDEAARLHQEEMRTLVNKAEAGVLKNGKVGLKQGEGRHGAHTADKDRTQRTMMNLMMQQAYQQAYDNEIAFSIGGKACKMKQGDMYKFARERLERTEKDLEDAVARRERGEITRLTDKRDAYREIADLTNPENGKMTAENVSRFKQILDSHQEVAADFKQVSQMSEDVTVEIDAVFSSSFEDVAVSGNSELPVAAPRTVSVARESDGAVFASAGNVTPIFGQAAENAQKPIPAPVMQIVQEEPEVSVIKAKSQAFNL